jgi:hypothetical protein
MKMSRHRTRKGSVWQRRHYEYWRVPEYLCPGQVDVGVGGEPGADRKPQDVGVPTHLLYSTANIYSWKDVCLLFSV